MYASKAYPVDDQKVKNVIPGRAVRLCIAYILEYSPMTGPLRAKWLIELVFYFGFCIVKKMKVFNSPWK